MQWRRYGLGVLQEHTCCFSRRRSMALRTTPSMAVLTGTSCCPAWSPMVAPNPRRPRTGPRGSGISPEPDRNPWWRSSPKPKKKRSSIFSVGSRDALSGFHPVRMEESSLWRRRHKEDGEEEGSDGDLDGEAPTDPRHSPIQGSMEGLPTSHVTEVKVTRRGPGPRPASRPGESALERFSLVPKTTSSDEAWLLGPRKMQDPLQTHSEALLPRPVSRQIGRAHV